MHRLLVVALALGAAVAEAAVDESTLRITPPRLGFIEGDVSFWRPGVGDWEPAQINVPLAAGDALASRAGQFELQIGGQSFARAGEDTELRVKSLEPDFLQIDVTQGSVVLDLRGLAAGRVYQIDTPHGAATARGDGYYRVDVGAESTRLTVRRAGAASLAPTGGQPVDLATGEAVVVSGGAVGQLDLAPAPGFDEWDRWNYARADEFLAAPRAAVVSADVYGAAELERHGGWRHVSTYGRVWAPYRVPAGWAPYTQGRWLYDPLYGWSWVDYAPWGWAPFHYGRWVYAGYWAWAPGPLLATPFYAPALVTFFGPSVSFSIGYGAGWVGWAPLGWGEPLVPWWGRYGFIGSPCWYGWGGPRVVNNIVINNGDTITADSINIYRNVSAPGGVVGVPKDQFGTPNMQRTRLGNISATDLKPLHGRAPAAGARAVSAGAAKAPLPNLGGRRADSAADGAIQADFARQTALNSPAAPPPASGRAPASTASLKPGQGADAFDRLRSQSRAAAAPRAAAPQQSAPAVGGRDLRRAAAPPPLRGQAKPSAGTEGFARLRSTRPTASADARIAAPPLQRSQARQAPAKADVAPAPSLRRAPAGSGWTRRPPAPPPVQPSGGDVERAAPLVPSVRAVARNYERAPEAGFRGTAMPKAMSAPSLPSVGAAGAGAGGGGGRGGGVPNFSR